LLAEVGSPAQARTKTVAFVLMLESAKKNKISIKMAERKRIQKGVKVVMPISR
jgi:hypothetical protein